MTLANGDFETGDLTGWTTDNEAWSDPADKTTVTTEAAAAAAHAGTYGGRLDVTWIAADQFYGETIIKQTLAGIGVNDGDIYDFWVKVPTYTADSAYVELRAYLWDGAEVAIDLWTGAAIQDWQHVTYTIDDGVDPTWEGNVQLIITAYAEKYTATTGGHIQLYVDDLTFSSQFMPWGECGGTSAADAPGLTYTMPFGECGGTGAAGAMPPILILDSIEGYDLGDTGITVKKNITDALWSMDAEIIGLDTPTYFRHLTVTMRDHLDVDHVVFYGFVIRSSAQRQAGVAMTVLSGYDYGWYLTQQYGLWMHLQPWTGYGGEDFPEVNEETLPNELICRLLGWTPDGGSWVSESGIEPTAINPVNNWGTLIPYKMFPVSESTTKMQTIRSIADHCGHIFEVKWILSGSLYHPAAYFLAIGDIDDYLDIPASVTIDDEDGFVEAITTIDNQDERKNFVRVTGMTVGEGGVWDVGSASTAAQGAGEELRIELQVKREDLDDAEICQDVAEVLLPIVSDPPTIYVVTMNERVDLMLYQGIYFTGFDELPTDLMRIIGIEYHKDRGGCWVVVQCVLGNDLSSMYLQRALVQTRTATTQAIARQVIRDEVPEDLVGEITAIADEVATVELEKDGRSIDARVGT
jgi:hypothetical protein